MKLTYLGHTLKRLPSGGVRHSRTGKTYRTLGKAKEAIAAEVFPYRHVGGPPIKTRPAR